MRRYKTRHMNMGISLVEAAMCAALISIVMVSVISAVTFMRDLADKTTANQTANARLLRSLPYLQRDLHSASRASLGSLLYNGGFEDAETAAKPRYWDDDLTHGGDYTYFDSTDSPNVRSGLRSLGVLRVGSSSSAYPETFIRPSLNTAYMISGWVKCKNTSTAAGIELIDKNGELLVSTQTAATEWMHIQCRFPASGKYTGGVPNDEIYLLLKVDKTGGGTAGAYFDDVGFSPIQAVLLSTGPLIVNTASASNPADPFDPAGFKFFRWDNLSLELYRYRVDTAGPSPQLKREWFNRDTSRWENAAPSYFGQGIIHFVLAFDQNGVLPPKGLDTPLQVSWVSKTDGKGKMAAVSRQEMVIRPLSP